MRPQGVSIIDLSWAILSLKDKIANWKVLSEVLSLSDHVYISSSLEQLIIQIEVEIMLQKDLKWSRKKKSTRTSFMQPRCGMAARNRLTKENSNAEERADWIISALRDCRDVGAPRASQNTHRSQVYWCNEEVASLRRETI